MVQEQITERPPPSPPPRRHHAGMLWTAGVVIFALLFFAGFAVTRWVIDPNSTSSPRSSATTTPLQPTDPNASLLPSLAVRQSDIGSNLSVQLLPHGNLVRGQPTLDLCNGRYPSEAHRTARFQDAVVDQQGNEVLSTEAVLYSNPAFTVQAFNELRAVAARCPSSPVPSPVGEPTVTTHFNAAPDATWPQTPGVERLAFSFTTVDQSGRSTPGLAVYLRRGRALVGVYFAQSALPQQPSVGDQTTVQGIAGVFAGRLGQASGSSLGA